MAARLSYPSLRHRAEQFGVLIPAIAVGIAWAPDALLRNILEALPILRKRGSISGRCFEPPEDHIAIGGVIFDQTAKPPPRQLAGAALLEAMASIGSGA